MGQDEGFLNRWSRRKLAEKERVEAEQVAAVPAASDDALVENAEVEAPERHPAEDIDIDSVGRDFDFSIFLQKGVPAALKQKALRKLWALDPVLREPEKLTDMFNIEDTKTWGLGPLRGTSWRVGEGYSWRDVLPETAEAPDDIPLPEERMAEAEPEGKSEKPDDELSAEEVEAEVTTADADAASTSDDHAEDERKG